jgi:hypothetical protein
MKSDENSARSGTYIVWMVPTVLYQRLDQLKRVRSEAKLAATDVDLARPRRCRSTMSQCVYFVFLDGEVQSEGNRNNLGE